MVGPWLSEGCGSCVKLSYRETSCAAILWWLIKPKGIFFYQKYASSLSTPRRDRLLETVSATRDCRYLPLCFSPTWKDCLPMLLLFLGIAGEIFRTFTRVSKPKWASNATTGVESHTDLKSPLRWMAVSV